MQALKVLIHPSRISRRIFQNRLIEGIKYVNPITRSISTIDIKEVEHLSGFKQQWWDKNGAMKGLHALNSLRVQLVRNGLANSGMKLENPCLPLEGIKIVDVGCGGGILTENLARVGAEATGIDPSVELIDIAKEHAKLDSDITERITYVQTSIEKFSQKNKDSYDVVITSEVLEHVADQEIFIKECVTILKPGGSLFITTINKTIASWLGIIIFAEYIAKIVPIGTHDWNKFISPHEVQRILENYGCKINLIHGMMYNPLKNTWDWSSCTAGSYVLHAIKGKKSNI